MRTYRALPIPSHWMALCASLVASAALSLPSIALADPCVVPEGPPGTVTLPPAGCDYLSPQEVHMILDGLPPGTTIELAPIHKNFICLEQPGSCSVPIPPGLCEAPGGSLGGNGDCFDSEIELQVTGTGALAGFNRILHVPLFTEVHTAPRNPGDPVQDFDTEMVQLQGQLFGDPDFCTLNIRAGSQFGLPSPGHTTLGDLGNGTFNVDSFFDVFYEIDFQGCPGSMLEGFGGTTQGTIRMEAGVPFQGANPCSVPDNGSGTVTLPPVGCEYLSPDEVHEIIDGLPPGTTIELAAIHKDFFCGPPDPLCSVVIPSGTCETAGGNLGGNVDCFDSTAELQITGSGSLAGFQRTIFLPLNVEVHTGPRTPGDAVQQFPTEMIRLDGQIFGDPDFCTLRIQGGSQFGLPSPGFTRLTDIGGGDFSVDSFFDVEYTIDYQGCPGSQLEGFGGTSQGNIRMETGDPTGLPPAGVPALSGGWLAAAGLLLGLTGAAAMLRRRR